MESPSKGGIIVCRPKPIPYQSGTVQGFTLMSDMHIGAPHVDYDLIKSELKKARKNNDRVWINGDVFDLILAKDMKRFSPDCLHPKLQGRADIINASVSMAVEMLTPFADLIDMVGRGNHEEVIARYHSVDVVKLLVERLQQVCAVKDHVIHYGGYGGFIDYRFRYKSENYDRLSKGKRFVVFYYHGSGGSAPQTHGMLDFSRKLWAEADVVHLGHKHNRFTSHIETLSCPMEGDQPVSKPVRRVMTGAYFDTYTGQSQASISEYGVRSNYAADAGCAPQGKGGARVTLTFPSLDKPFDIQVTQ